MGLENRRSGNVSEGSNPSLSAISPENADFSSDDVSRCSRCVPDDDDGASVGTVLALDDDELADLISEAISDSLDVDWRPIDAARYVVTALRGFDAARGEA